MISSNWQEATESIAELVANICGKGVQLWSKDGQLHYKALKGVLTQYELESLLLYKKQICIFLEESNDSKIAGPLMAPRGGANRFPLTYSQLAYWQQNKLGQRLGLRETSSVTRLLGRLNVGVLRNSLPDLVRRHNALRTRIVVLNGVPTQEVSEAGDCELHVVDLSMYSNNSCQSEIENQIESHLLEQSDVSADPPFSVKLLKLSADEHVLIIAMDHIVSDGASLNIFLRDLLSIYAQRLQSLTPSLPSIPVQFYEFSLWQKSIQEKWVSTHGRFWRERMAGYRECRFPVDASICTAANIGWAGVPFEIDRDLTEELRKWCRLRGTTLVMGLFTAYVGLVLRWCKVSEIVIGYQTSGRSDPRVENAIGFFAVVLFLRVKLFDDDTVIDLMTRINKEYCSAHDNIDFSYLEAQLPPLEFVKSSVFNWLPQDLKNNVANVEESLTKLKISSVPFSHPALIRSKVDADPTVVLSDRGDVIAGNIYFPLSRFHVETMERFAKNFLVFARIWAKEPESRIKDILVF